MSLSLMNAFPGTSRNLLGAPERAARPRVTAETRDRDSFPPGNSGHHDRGGVAPAAGLAFGAYLADAHPET